MEVYKTLARAAMLSEHVTLIEDHTLIVRLLNEKNEIMETIPWSSFNSLEPLVFKPAPIGGLYRVSVECADTVFTGKIEMPPISASFV